MKKGNIKILQTLSLLSYIGVVMFVPIIAAVYIGNFLDKLFKTRYIFLLICIIIGVLSGFLNVYKIVMKDIQKKRK